MRQGINFVIFILSIILICYLIMHSRKEKFTNFLEGIDFFRENPKEISLVPLKNKKTYGWKQYYKDNYMKGDFENLDSFEGTVIRNYLDNLNFFQN